MKYCLLLLALFSVSSFSAYWIDTAGKVTAIITYAGTETILVTLSNHGTDVAECASKTTFAVSKSISAEARSRMYAMLLSAQATGRNITVSYSNIGGCEPYGANANAYRKIARLR